MNADDIAEWEEFMEQDLAGNANESVGRGRAQIADMYEMLYEYAERLLEINRQL